MRLVFVCIDFGHTQIAKLLAQLGNCLFVLHTAVHSLECLQSRLHTRNWEQLRVAKEPELARTRLTAVGQLVVVATPRIKNAAHDATQRREVVLELLRGELVVGAGDSANELVNVCSLLLVLKRLDGVKKNLSRGY